MKKIQIYLEDSQYDRLKEISQGRDLARLIREAIDLVYPRENKASLKDVIHEAAGIWKEKTDIDASRKGKKRRAYLEPLE